MKFEDLIGKKVPMVIPMMHAQLLQEAVIRGVEYGGLWIECEEFTQSLLVGLKMPAGKTPILFVPFHEIKYAFYGDMKLALSDKAFGV